MTRQSKWDLRFMDLAKLIASWSRDPSTQVGACIVDSSMRVVSVGYNGFARHVKDDPSRYNDRDIKLKRTIHAEENAMLFAQRSCEGFCLYTWPMLPCAKCAGKVIQVGICRVVAPYSLNPRWQDDIAMAKNDFNEAGVDVVELVGHCADKSDIEPVYCEPLREK